MLTRKRAAKTGGQVSRRFNERPEVSDAGLGHQIKIEAHVDAGLAKVSVKRAPVSKPVPQPRQLAQILAQFFDRNGRVFPSLPEFGIARYARRSRQARLARLPHHLRLLLVLK